MTRDEILTKAKYEQDEREVFIKLKAYKTSGVVTLIYVIILSMIFTVVENNVNPGPAPLSMFYQDIALIIFSVVFVYTEAFNTYMYIKLKNDGALFKMLIFGILLLLTTTYFIAVVI